MRIAVSKKAFLYKIRFAIYRISFVEAQNVIVRAYFTVNLPLENSLRSWKFCHSHSVKGCFSFDNRIDFTSISLTGKRILKVWFSLGRITLSRRQGTRSRCGAAIELPFQFAGSAQKTLPSFDHLLIFASARELL